MTTEKFGYAPSQPGELLKAEMENHKLSHDQLARRMGMTYKTLNDLLTGRRPVTASLALMFEAALDVPADSLMRMQLKLDMQKALNDPVITERVNKIRSSATSL